MNKLGRKFIVVGVSLILLAVGIFGYNSYEDLEAGVKSANVVEVIRDKIVGESVVNVSDFDGEMERVVVDDYGYIGLLYIPSLSLDLPVMAEYDYDRLRVAPCRYYGSVYTNDLVICAHSYKTHFGYLSKLEQGDQVVITDVKGVVYVYEVLEIEVLGAEDVYGMLNSEFDLTLYTCTSDGGSRITVRCNKVSEVVDGENT